MFMHPAGGRARPTEWRPADHVTPNVEVDRLVRADHRGADARATPRASETRSAGKGDATRTAPSVKRGAVLGRCLPGSRFRECRGGEALHTGSVGHERFDQYDFRRLRTPEHRGACDGAVWEALRRIDRSDVRQPLTLQSAVRQMSVEAKRGGLAAADMFDRVIDLQASPATLALRRHTQAPVVYSDPHGERGERVDGMLGAARGHLRNSGDLAVLRVGLTVRGSNEGRTGHTLAIQRQQHDRYTIFDPNNGAFVYPTWRAADHALRGYLDDAFGEAGRIVVPDSLEFFSASRSPSQGASAQTVEAVVAPADAWADASQPGPSSQSHSGAATLRAYADTADASNHLSDDGLSAAAGQRRVMAGMCSGLVVRAMENVARGRAPDLLSAVEDIRVQLGNAASRQSTIRDIAELQEQNQYAVVAEITDRLRHAGATGIRSGAALVDDLRRQFATAYYRDHAVRGSRNDFAEIGLTFRSVDSDDPNASESDDAQGHSIVVQRLRPSADFERDGYAVYDPGVGVFRYADFARMSSALRSLFDNGYPESGGIERADTTWFADSRREHQVLPVLPMPSTSRESPAADMRLGSVERMLDIGGSPAMTPPHATLPPPPDVNTGPTSLAGSGHDELKRSPERPQAERRPYALFRPSTLSPEVLMARGGFDMEQTKLRDVDLDLHDADLAARPAVTDSAGYLATFRNERVALGRLRAHAQNGFVYFVAPTPNMIDVGATLGSHARDPQSGEIAAMGRIDYEQIRGWRAVTGGIAGEFIKNPKYRWDVYDRTGTAGAQPQLARMPITGDAWHTAPHRSFVSTGENGAAVFHCDPNVEHAAFYDNAWQKVRNLQMRQAMGVDYRGPLTIQAYGGDASRTHVFIDGYGQVAADTAYSRYARHAGNRSSFAIGDDGRFHLANDHGAVLRVGNDGYVYLGRIPEDPASLNGVFAYDGRHLVHREDDKYLTVGKTAFTPFVTRWDAGWRSDWRLERPDGQRAAPPSTNLHTFDARAAGSRQQLFRFEEDPDTALPETATHFVTRVPVNRFYGDFADYASHMTAGDARDVARWLDSQNAAWLFRDGYYAVPDRTGGLQVRTVGGSTVQRISGTSAAGKDDGAGGPSRRLPDRAGRAYRISDDAWQRVQEGEARREFLRTALRGVYFMK